MRPVSLLLAVLVAAARAQDPSLPAGPHAVEVRGGIDYWGEPLGREIPLVKGRDGAEQPRYRISVDAYLPQGASRPLPMVLLIHGGGLGEGRPEAMALPARWLASHGYAALTPGYTLGQGLAPATIDMRQCIRYLRLHAAELGLDPERFGALGYSAGGWIASMLAVLDDGAVRTELVKDSRGVKTKQQVAYDGGPLLGKVSARLQAVVLSSGNQLGKVADAFDRADPPILAYAGEKEAGRAGLLATPEAVAAAGFPYESWGIAGGGHCPKLTLRFAVDGRDTLLADHVRGFLDRHLKP